jgi:mannose-6-phosphate isomerase-like protein (cupin superfamily)
MTQHTTGTGDVANSIVGFASEDPRRGMRFQVVDVDPAGAGFALEYWSRAGSKPESRAHVHERWTESFDIITGRAQYRIGTDIRSAAAGETIVFPVGVAHVHPWNVGDTDLHVRQASRIAPPSTDAIVDTLAGFATLYRLSREGNVNARTGLPTPLQLAVVLRRFQSHGNYLDGLPRPVQRILFGLLGRIGSAAGYRLDTLR